ncbi:MAG: tRNA (N(6)-L-threonylcarbamoyladenosine(37)-C(2))-methylthiotransferase [Methanoregula sp.]|nr:tRNA (N(6)-L-threonylcarbamoyladenosine(37)-C(2))-methylthiotransferase [Methanoregula sp.]
MPVKGSGNDCGSTVNTGWLEALANRCVFIETYGCRYNFGDTAKLVEILKSNGSTIVGSADVADAVVINTCTVVGPTERRMLRQLSRYRDHELYVTGCMPEVQQEAIFSVCTPTLIPPEKIREEYRKVMTVAKEGPGIVQIAQGCLGQCTYCLTRFARGPLKSFSKGECLSQVQTFVRSGIPEIQLTAQDVSAWGRDCGRTFPELLTAISDIPGRFMVRVGMMNPTTVNYCLDDLVDAFSDDRIFKFVHIPFQSGSDAVLTRMGRQYTVAECGKIVAAFRKRYPDITIATDVIVGFPKETEADFSSSCDLIDRVRPNKVNITRYSSRPFTLISSEKDFPDSVKKDRSRILNARAELLYGVLNRPLLGTVVPFIVTEIIRKGSVMARAPNYTGIVLNEDLPAGYEGRAILVKDQKYFFIGKQVC